MGLQEKSDYIEFSGSDLTATKSVFAFPVGRRFQFAEPSGNAFGVWSDKRLAD